MNEKSIKIAILGLGHVGLPTALGLAELGWDVIGADSDSNKVAQLKSRAPFFYERGLQELLEKHLASKKFTPTDDLDAAVRAASVLFVCVGTPQKQSGEADLAQVEAVVRVIAKNRNGYKLIIEKSTVPVITAQWIKKTIRRYSGLDQNHSFGAEANESASDNPQRRNNDGFPFDVASNPEFLQEGTALDDFFTPDRIICGVESEKAKRLLEEIYRPLQCPIVFTDLNTAELIKHSANAFLATKISFINMISDMCEVVGADVTAIARGIGLDPRIGHSFLQAGIGFGGYCLPKDLRAFIHMAEGRGVDFSLLKEVEKVNLSRPNLFLKKVREALWVLQGKTVAVLGLAFKPATDDIREAPSLKLIECLLREGASLRLYDPQAMKNVEAVFPEETGRIEYCPSPYEAALGAEAILVLTEWDEFKELDFKKIRRNMKVPVVIDGRNLYEPTHMARLGFEYHSIGRSPVGRD